MKKQEFLDFISAEQRRGGCPVFRWDLTAKGKLCCTD